MGPAAGVDRGRRLRRSRPGGDRPRLLHRPDLRRRHDRRRDDPWRGGRPEPPHARVRHEPRLGRAGWHGPDRGRSRGRARRRPGRPRHAREPRRRRGRHVGDPDLLLRRDLGVRPERRPRDGRRDRPIQLLLNHGRPVLQPRCGPLRPVPDPDHRLRQRHDRRRDHPRRPDRPEPGDARAAARRRDLGGDLRDLGRPGRARPDRAGGRPPRGLRDTRRPVDRLGRVERPVGGRVGRPIPRQPVRRAARRSDLSRRSVAGRSLVPAVPGRDGGDADAPARPGRRDDPGDPVRRGRGRRRPARPGHRPVVRRRIAGRRPPGPRRSIRHGPPLRRDLQPERPARAQGPGRDHGRPGRGAPIHAGSGRPAMDGRRQDHGRAHDPLRVRGPVLRPDRLERVDQLRPGDHRRAGQLRPIAESASRRHHAHRARPGVAPRRRHDQPRRGPSPDPDGQRPRRGRRRQHPQGRDLRVLRRALAGHRQHLSGDRPEHDLLDRLRVPRQPRRHPGEQRRDAVRPLGQDVALPCDDPVGRGAT